MPISGRQRALALAGAILVHLGVAGVLLWQPADRGAAGAGVGGIEVSLAPTGGSPGTARSATAVSETATLAPDAASTEIPPASAVTAEPPETVAETPPEPAATGTSPEDAAIETPPEAIAVEAPEPAPVPPAEAREATRAVQAPEAAPTERTVRVEPAEAPPVLPAVRARRQPPVEASETPPPDTVIARAATPLPPAPKPPAPKPPAPEAPAPTRETTREPAPRRAVQEIARPPSAAGAGGKAGTEASPQAGSGAATSGGGNPAATVDYMATLQAWLERHKEYPRRAQMRRQEGTALLYFIMDRSGRVLDYRLQRSSGHALLDREVAAMIERAQPLPKMPPGMRQSRLELVVPVQFFLR